jgi:hypothetical protein
MIAKRPVGGRQTHRLHQRPPGEEQLYGRPQGGEAKRD